MDLVYYGNQRQLEYDLIVTPGADPDAIQFAFEGEHNLEIDAQGNLVVHTSGGKVRLQKPLVYQEADGVRREISGAYVLRGRRQVGFRVAAYDASKLLTIDPVMSYSTYLGSSGDDIGIDIAVDASGNAYVTGLTDSTTFPTANALEGLFRGRSDVFIAKLNAEGSALVYSTYLGGSGTDFGVGIAVDSAGNVYATGYTDSTDFPRANALQADFGGSFDAFVTKLDPTGSALVYSTYLGGSGSDVGLGIAMDSSGNAYTVGTTNSTDYPTANSFQAAFGGGNRDGFVTKLNTAGSALVYSTYLGGSRDDIGIDIAVDISGNAYVTGSTRSANFPATMDGFQSSCQGQFDDFCFSEDAFVTKLNDEGSGLVYSTYLGGRGLDTGFGIAVDSAGNAYVTGYTASADFPTASPLQPALNGRQKDAFVTKLDPAGSALVYSTYLGGDRNDGGTGIAVDSFGNVYVAGGTISTNFPTANPLQAASGGGSLQAFVTKLDPAGLGARYSTYLGGGGSGNGGGFFGAFLLGLNPKAFLVSLQLGIRGNDGATSIAVDSSGNAYMTGGTNSTNFPTLNSVQPASGGGFDAFVTKTVELPPGMPGPILPPNSVVNVASFRPATDPNGAIAGGAIVAIFGMDLASDTQVASAVPLPTTLGDTSVTFNNIPAPLFFVSGTQINAQVPFEVPTSAVSVLVKRGNNASAVQAVNAAGVSPGIFTVNQQGTGPGATLHADDFQPVSQSAPARPGEFLLIFCTGLGPV